MKRPRGRARRPSHPRWMAGRDVRTSEGAVCAIARTINPLAGRVAPGPMARRRTAIPPISRVKAALPRDRATRVAAVPPDPNAKNLRPIHYSGRVIPMGMDREKLQSCPNHHDALHYRTNRGRLSTTSVVFVGDSCGTTVAYRRGANTGMSSTSGFLSFVAGRPAHHQSTPPSLQTVGSAMLMLGCVVLSGGCAFKA